MGDKGNIKEQVKQLWQRVFEADSAEFVDYYFDNLYDDNCSFSISKEGVVVSALQSLPYPFSYCGVTIGMRYISGASTYVEDRGEGLMGRLMRESIVAAYVSGDALMTLIPANVGLYGYYGGFGFAPIFKKLLKGYQYSDIDISGYSIQSINSKNRGAIYKYLHYKQGDMLASVLHTECGFEHISFDYGKRVYALLDSADDICGVAFVSEDNCVNLIACNVDKQMDIFLNLICKLVGLAQINYYVADNRGKNWGMGRVINAEKLLTIYAKANPKIAIKFAVKDKIIAENNRVFEIDSGGVITTEIVDGISTISIEELTNILLGDINADLSLMLE